MYVQFAINDNGSPPRAWGQRLGDVGERSSARFTPTGVGTTFFVDVVEQLLQVHPHGRGDNGAPMTLMGYPIGSPPRAWGQPSGSRLSITPTRFTPTGVGTTLDGVVLLERQPRFTPTGVGTTRGICQRMPRFTVHPHGRGDNNSGFDHPPGEGGSPPRAWGQRRRRNRSHRPLRFTPTGVGTTSLLCLL